MRKVNIKKAGRNFGIMCGYVGLFGVLISLLVVPSSFGYEVSAKGIIMMIVSSAIYAYGHWRSGGII